MLENNLNSSLSLLYLKNSVYVHKSKISPPLCPVFCPSCPCALAPRWFCTQKRRLDFGPLGIITLWLEYKLRVHKACTNCAIQKISCVCVCVCVCEPLQSNCSFSCPVLTFVYLEFISLLKLGEKRRRSTVYNKSHVLDFFGNTQLIPIGYWHYNRPRVRHMGQTVFRHCTFVRPGDPDPDSYYKSRIRIRMERYKSIQRWLWTVLW